MNHKIHNYGQQNLNKIEFEVYKVEFVNSLLVFE